MAFAVGSSAGDYEIVSILGAGGMGQVYKVRNTISDRVEAMKVLLPNLSGDPELAERFMREIKVQAALDHPNIAALHTALRVENQLVMVMEFVEGRTIESILRTERVPPRQAVGYMCQVLSALAYAHGRGVIHRDIKPANMMLTGAGVVKLMDFGIAKLAADRHLTQTGRTVGSLYYMSPEQIQGATTLDARADLYSVGVSLYEMVTGARPFQGDSDFSIMAAHMNVTPAPPMQYDPDLPAALNEVILMSIAKEPERRFQTADAFRNALTVAAKDLPVAPLVEAGTRVVTATMPQTPPPAPVPEVQKSSHRALYMVLGSLATVLALALAITQAPKFFSTNASRGTVPVNTQPAPEPAVPKQIVQPPIQQEKQVTTAPPPVAQAPVTKPPVTQTQVAQTPAVQTPAVQTPAVQTPAVQTPVVQAPLKPAGPDPAVLKAIGELRDRQGLMAVRADTVRGSLSRLTQEQASSGLGPSPELTSAARRLQGHMEQASAHLRENDPEAAKKSLDAAERELEKLEEKFNR